MKDNISMVIKDAHIHLSFLSEQSLQTYFQQAKKLNVSAFALGGYDQEDWVKQIEIKKNNSNIKICFGLHPWVIQEKSEIELDKEWSFLLNIAGQADAIGETGIDRFRTRNEAIIEKQIKYFGQALELVEQLNKPLVLHVVQAHDKALKLIDQFRKTYGVAHSFTGSYEIAKEYVKRGYLISIGPMVLNKGFKNLKEVVQQIDLDNLLIESDDSIDPQDLVKVAEKVAELKSCDIEIVLEKTAANFDKVFK